MPNSPDVVNFGFVLGHGGDAVQMLELASGIARRGMRVQVVVPDLETTAGLEHRYQVPNLRLERSPLLRADQHSSRQNLWDLVRLFRSHQAPIVHFHTGDVCLPRLVLLALELVRAPRSVVTIHSPYDTVRPGDIRARHWASAVSHHIFRVVCPSDHSRRTQISYGVAPAKLSTIHNCVDTDCYAGGDGASARRLLGVGEDRRLILFTSRLEPQKRPLDALTAFRAIAGEHADVDLVFVGRGSLEGDLRLDAQRSGLNGRVHFAGYQENVPDWLAATEVWFLPTESENFSLAVLEALAAGLPIVSTCCPGNDEVLEDGHNALLTPVGSIPAMVAALQRVLSDTALRQTLSSQARSTAAKYSVERMVNAYARVYNECVGSVRAPTALSASFR